MLASNTFCRNGKTICFARKIVSAEYYIGIQFAMLVPRKTEIREDIFNLLRSPLIDSKESIPPAYVTGLAGTTTLFLIGS
jgi:hypothetical protein